MKKSPMSVSYSSLLMLIALATISCQKELSTEDPLSTRSSVSQPALVPANAILVDASKDGGVWWFPQRDVFSADEPHQGKALADYLRSLGFKVTELGRGETVTKEVLQGHRYVIRAAAFTPYTEAELVAYEQFLSRPVSLLLATDHQQYTQNDALNKKLGLNFSGSYTGVIDSLKTHVITEGIASLSFIGGAVIEETPSEKVVPLGYVNTGNLGRKPLAMGILQHPQAKIFFIGDLNGLELLPQPFANNLVKWLFPQ